MTSLKEPEHVRFVSKADSFRLSQRCLVWMAPALQGLFDVVAAKSGTVLCPACWCGVKTAGPDGIRGSGPYLLCGLKHPGHRSGCPHPRSDRFAIMSHRPRNR